MSLPETSLPHVDAALFDRPTSTRHAARGTRHAARGTRHASVGSSVHAPRFLLLHGSLRERSYSKLLTLATARLLTAMGGEVRIFDPTGLPLADAEPESHPKVQELHDARPGRKAWSEPRPSVTAQ